MATTKKNDGFVYNFFLDPFDNINCNVGNTIHGECYENEGTCSDGVCTYSKKAIGSECSNGTCDIFGLCDACASVICDSPPGDCFADVGFCYGSGICSYDFKDEGEVCSNGECNKTQIKFNFLYNRSMLVHLRFDHKYLCSCFNAKFSFVWTILNLRILKVLN